MKWRSIGNHKVSMAIWKKDYQPLHQHHYPIIQRRLSTAISEYYQSIISAIDYQQLTATSQVKDKVHMGWCDRCCTLEAKPKGV